MIPALVPIMPAPPTKLIDIINSLGLATNLRVCLDAGDSNSYDGSSQVWTDVSGGGNHFNCGSGSGSDSADPTFNGNSGRQSVGEYFSYDGGDRFTLAQSAPSWQSGMHKAGGAFTILQWAYVPTLTGLGPSQAGFSCGDGTSLSDGTDAINFSNSGSVQNALTMTVQNHSAAIVVGAKSTLLVTNNAWQMIAGAIDVNAKTILFAINGSTESPANVGAASADTTDSHVPLLIGASAADGTASVKSGGRIGSTAIFASALSAANLVAIFNATRGRFGV